MKVLVDVLDKRVIGADQNKKGRGLIQLVCFSIACILISRPATILYKNVIIFFLFL
jgi:hypothetical protein